ncbi:hypothetical protein KC19_2G063700 [Ceratodon purpureus]|uniref:Subtilisin-like protease n=1 Tax=Ceratodon purpureus TaxID=3225 RepID=A0A8T0IQS1_CERPU|nr:hypothetical protein KC19_2G063700 [Ceratodon purpureus]
MIAAMESTHSWFFQFFLLILLSSLLHVSNCAPVGSKTYIIHTVKNSTHLDVMAKHAWYTELMAGAKQLLVDDHPDDGMDTLHHVYHHVLNGFSARLTPEQADFMATLPCVIAVYPDRMRHAQTTHTPEFLGLSGEDSDLWPESRFGENVIIGVMDTGIWPERLSFSDRLLEPIPAWKGWKGECEAGTNFTAANCNNKIIGARYILKGFEAEFGPIIDTVTDYRSPRDYFSGHGTHCASTAAGRWAYRASASGQGKGTARGMAPRARIAVYKVLWSNQNKSSAGADSDFIQAFDQAVEDGVDILSVSIGPPVNELGINDLWQDGIAVAAFNAAKRGIFVSVAGGNSGPLEGSIANVSPWMTTVAATTMDRDILSNVVLGDGTVVTGRSAYDGKALKGKAIPIIYGGDASISRNVVENASFCQPGTLNESLVTGKILLCDYDYPKHRFPLPFPNGTVGVILGNTAELGDGLQYRVSDHIPLFGGGFPIVNIGNVARAKLMAYIRGVTGTLPIASILGATTVSNVTPAPQVSAFSSRGPINIAQRLETQWLKPDIAAPGQDILAAGVRNQQYAYMSGTSMACPHISGIGALLRSVHPDWSPAAIKSAMMTTAKTFDNRNKTITAVETGMAATPWAFGAGFVQPEKAMNPGLVYDMGSTDHLLFLCGLGYDYETIRIFDMDAGFECPSDPPARIEDANLPSFVAVFPVPPVGANATDISFNRTLTNVATGGSTYRASVHMEQGAKFDVVVEPATLTFAGEGSVQKFSLIVSPRAGAVFSDIGSDMESIINYFATISWSDGVHIVQSPVAIIVVT